MTQIDRQFVIDNLLTKSGRLNPRALEKVNISGETAYQLFHGLTGPSTCKSCNTITKLISFAKGYSNFCSKACASGNKEVIEKRQQTVLANYGGYGSLEITEKKKSTCRKKYGVDWARQSENYITGLKELWADTHGVASFSHSDTAVEKRNNTNLKKYGYANPMQNEGIKLKTAETNIIRYGVKSTLVLEQNRQKANAARRDSVVYTLLNDILWLEANKDVSSVVLAAKLGIAWSTVLHYFDKYNIIRTKFTVSSTQQKVCELLDSMNIEYEINNRQILNGKEIDIFIASHNLGIEIDGIYWHSTQFIKDPLYHQQKMIVAKSKSIQLLHITDDEIHNKFDIVRERLYNKLGKSSRVHGRKCKLIEIDNSTYKLFVSTHHIQGYAAASIRYALIWKQEIQAVMSFSKARFNKQYQWELVRYASKNTVVGGASKLLKHFITQNLPVSIISYADLRWNTGAMYEKIGLTFSHTTLPNYWYITNKGLEHRSAFQKHKLKNKLALYDPNKSEWQNMEDNNFYKFWDCGNNVYVWRTNNEN